MEIPKFRPPSASFRKKQRSPQATKFIPDQQDDSFLQNNSFGSCNNASAIQFQSSFISNNNNNNKNEIHNSKLSLQEELDLIPTSEELEQQFMKLYGRLHDDRTLAEWLNLGQQSTIGDDLNAELEAQTQRERDFIRANEKLLGDDNMRLLAVNYEDGFLLDDIREDRRQRIIQEKQTRREEKLKQILEGSSRLAQLQKNEEIMERRRRSTLKQEGKSDGANDFSDYLDYSGEAGSGSEHESGGIANSNNNGNQNDENKKGKNSFAKKPATATTSWEAELALRRAAFLSGVSTTSALSRFLVRSHGGDDEDDDDANNLNNPKKGDDDEDEDSGDDAINRDDEQRQMYNSSRMLLSQTKTATGKGSIRRLQFDDDDEEYFDAKEEEKRKRKALRTQSALQSRENKARHRADDIAHGKLSGEAVWIPAEPHYFVECPRSSSDDDDQDDESDQLYDEDEDNNSNLRPVENAKDVQFLPSGGAAMERKRKQKCVPPPVAKLNEKCCPIQMEIAKFLSLETMINGKNNNNGDGSNQLSRDPFIKKTRTLLSQARELFIVAADFAYEVEQKFWDEINQDSFLSKSFQDKFDGGVKSNKSSKNRNLPPNPKNEGMAAMKARKQKNMVQSAVNKNNKNENENDDDDDDENVDVSKNKNNISNEENNDNTQNTKLHRRRSITLLHGGNTGGGKFSILGDDNLIQRDQNEGSINNLESILSVKSFRSQESSTYDDNSNAEKNNQYTVDDDVENEDPDKSSSILVSSTNKTRNLKKTVVSFSKRIDSTNNSKSNRSKSFLDYDEDDEDSNEAFDEDEARFLDENGKNLLTPGNGPPEGALQRIKTFIDRGLYQLDVELSKELPEAKFEEFPQLSEHHYQNNHKNGKKLKNRSKNEKTLSSPNLLATAATTSSGIFNYGDTNYNNKRGNNDDEDSSDDDEDEQHARSGKVKIKKTVRHLFGSHKNLGNALLQQEQMKQQILPQQLGAPSPISIFSNVSNAQDEKNSSINSPTGNNTTSNDDKLSSSTSKNPVNSPTSPFPSGFNDNTYLQSAQAILNASSSPMNNGNASFAEDRRYGVVLGLVATVLDSLLHTSDSSNNILQQTALELEVIMSEMRQLVAERIEHVLARDEALGEITFAVEEIQALFRCAARTSVHIQDESVFRGIVRTFVAASRRMQDFARDIARIGEVAMLDAKELRARLAKAKPDHEQMIVALLELADAIETQAVAVPRHAQWRRKALDELYWNLQSAIATLSTLELAGDEVADEIVNSNKNASHTSVVALHVRDLVVNQKLAMEEVCAMYLKDPRTGVAERSVMKGTALAIAARRKLRETGRAMDNEWGFSCW